VRFEKYKQSDMAADNTVPEATYKLRCNKVTFKEPQEDGKTCDVAGETEAGIPTFVNKKGETVFPYLSLDWVIQDDGETFGRHVFDNYVSLAPGDDWKVRQIMKSLEFSEDDAFDTDEWIDRECFGVVTKQKEGKGKDGKWYPAQNRVGRYMGLNETQK